VHDAVVGRVCEDIILPFTPDRRCPLYFAAVALLGDVTKGKSGRGWVGVPYQCMRRGITRKTSGSRPYRDGRSLLQAITGGEMRPRSSHGAYARPRSAQQACRELCHHVTPGPHPGHGAARRNDRDMLARSSDLTGRRSRAVAAGRCTQTPTSTNITWNPSFRSSCAAPWFVAKEPTEYRACVAPMDTPPPSRVYSYSQ